MKQVVNYINGEFCESASKRLLDNINPASGQVYGELVNSNHEDLDAAVAAALQAFPRWMSMSVEKRADYLNSIADEIERSLDELALAESIDNGKPLTLARVVDIPRAASNFRFFAHAITQFSSESHSLGDLGLNYTLRDPIGVVGCISPWNLPLYLFSWKIAPALAAGNCVIAKPSELTPMTAFLLAKICQKVGLPKGVLNILHGVGAEIGRDICAHKDIKAISFTGGTETGRQISSIAAPMFKKLSLELGGKNPTLVFDDCDFEATVSGVVKSAFTNQGQICLCGSRVYIQEKIYEQFSKAFINKTKSIVLGDPLLENTQMGALISSQPQDKVLRLIQSAKDDGAVIETGGAKETLAGRCQDGYFVQPTVITGLSNEAAINQQEVFGPVVSLQAFKDEDEAIKLANDSQYGLSASVWSQNIQSCHRVAKKIDTGIVWLNSWMVRDLRTPFGGNKQSGVGREGGIEALKFFTQAKNVFVKY